MTPGSRSNTSITGVLAWLQFSITSFDCGKWSNLRVAVQGEYSHNRQEAGPVIKMIIAAALASPWAPVTGVLCDLSALNYTWGDKLLIWRHILEKHTNPKVRYAILASQSNLPHISSLIDDEDEPSLKALLFSDDAKAIDFLCNGSSP